MSAAAKLESPSSERNKLPIWENVFVPHLLAQSEDSEGQRTLRVLEVAAGSGVHTQFFGQQLAGKNVSVTWQSTDPEDSALASQEAYIREMVPDDAASSSTTASPPWTCGSVTFLAPLPLTLDTAGICQPETDEAIAAESIDWVYNINMIHISPWSATVGLMRMAGRKLKPSGKMFLYGPYRVNGTCVESNVKFEEWLKEKDPGYGVRNLEDVLAEASVNELELVETINMPANNLGVILQKRG